MSMKNYMATGQELLDFDPDIVNDSNGNKIISSFNYIITEIITEEKKMIIIRTEENYIRDKKIIKTMVYTKKGFDYLIEAMINSEIESIEGQENEINNMIDTLASLEDYESAESLKKDWENYKNSKNE